MIELHYMDSNAIPERASCGAGINHLYKVTNNGEHYGNVAQRMYENAAEAWIATTFDDEGTETTVWDDNNMAANFDNVKDAMRAVVENYGRRQAV